MELFDTKKMLSFTGSRPVDQVSETNLVFNHLKERNSLNNVFFSGKNDYNFFAALITVNIDDNAYFFKVATSGAKGHQIVNRKVYELTENQINVLEPFWDKQSESYVCKINRTEDKKNIAFSYDVILSNNYRITIVSEDAIVRQIFDNKKLTLSSNYNENNLLETVDIELGIKNYQYYDKLEMIWERKYDIPLTKYNIIEKTYFDSQKIFKKDFCGKYIKLTATENIWSPVGLYKNGKYIYKLFKGSSIVSNQHYIKPGMLCQYKLNSNIVDNYIEIKAEFISNNAQNEDDYQILYWLQKDGKNNWKQINYTGNVLYKEYNKEIDQEFKLVYKLKQGNKQDVAYTESLLIESLSNLTLSMDNNYIIVNLPSFINVYEVDFKWFEHINGEYVLINNKSNMLLLDNHENKNYIVNLNYKNIINDLTLGPINPSNFIIDKLVNIEFIESQNDLIVIKATSDFENEKNVQYIWGSDSTIFDNKNDNVISLPRMEKSKRYWVFANYKNFNTNKTYFDIPEAFIPNISFEQIGKKIIAHINNQNIDIDNLIFEWQVSNNNRKWEELNHLNSNVIDISNYQHINYVRVKLSYKLTNDIMFSSVYRIK